MSLNSEIIILSYDFKNICPGDGDGTIKIGFCGECTENIGSISVSWSKDGNVLDDYTPICTLSADELEKGYAIDKEMKIPYGADGICAEFESDGNKISVSILIPSEKITPDYGEKLFTAALTSDYHFGGWGSKLSPKKGIANGIADMNKYADIVFANGDLVQWHAAYSKEEFQKYNWNGKTYGDNGETSTEFLRIGVSQWQVLEDAFKTFNIPVYVTSGGHDIPDTPKWSKLCCTDKYWKDFQDSWTKYSVQNGFYPKDFTRNEDVCYHDTYFKGYHFIMTQIPRSVEPFDRFGDEQLKWLDKKLFENEESGKPVFIFGHNPVHESLAGRHGLDETADADKFVEILKKHPTSVYVSGHSHHTLDARRKNTVDGRQDEPSYVHDGGMTSITFPPTFSQVEGTHLVFADFYEDKVVIRARDALNEKWISKGLTELTLKKKCPIADISVTKDGNILTAKCDTESVKFVWYLDGEAYDGESITLDRNFDGFVAVRAYDQEGNYKSVVFDHINNI